MSSLQQRANFVLLVSSPSGVGKSTLCNMLMEKHPSVAVSISATTREPRPGEINGKHYFFLSKKEFKAKIVANEFVEHSEVYGNYYGTLKSEVERLFNAGKVPLFNVDFNGSLQIKKALKDVYVVTIFLLPPSLQAVYNRLVSRHQDSPETIENRVIAAVPVIKQYSKYEYVIVNDDLSVAFDDLCAIYNASRIKVAAQTTIPSFVRKLCKQKINKVAVPLQASPNSANFFEKMFKGFYDMLNRIKQKLNTNAYLPVIVKDNLPVPISKIHPSTAIVVKKQRRDTGLAIVERKGKSITKTKPIDGISFGTMSTIRSSFSKGTHGKGMVNNMASPSPSKIKNAS